MNPIYQISAFGHTKHFTKEINEALSKQLGEFGLSVGNEVVIDLNGSITSKNPKISAVGLFFGNDLKLAYTRPPALSDYDPIIPIVSSLERCSIELPTNVSAYNAMPSGGPNSPTRIAAAAIEALGLMPSRRRVFLSYRRNEARKAALQLFDELSERQFDVFLDTHEIRPGAVFQDVLWHHLSDCDVMLMLDTTSYFKSRWTTEEFGQANLKKASILRIGYPGVVRDNNLSVTDTLALSDADFTEDETFTASALDQLADGVERLRSKSVAVRQSNLVGSFRAAVKQFKGDLSGPGQLRRVLATFPEGKELRVYPVVGVPTSEVVNRIVLDAEEHECALLYDNIGILQSWQEHLEWLGERVDRFHWIKAEASYQALKGILG